MIQNNYNINNKKFSNKSGINFKGIERVVGHKFSDVQYLMIKLNNIKSNDLDKYHEFLKFLGEPEQDIMLLSFCEKLNEIAVDGIILPNAKILKKNSSKVFEMTILKFYSLCAKLTKEFKCANNVLSFSEKQEFGYKFIKYLKVVGADINTSFKMSQLLFSDENKANVIHEVSQNINKHIDKEMKKYFA